MLKNKIMGLAAAIITILVLSGCTYHNGIRINSSFSSSGTHMKSSYSTFDGTDKKSIKLKEGDRIKITYESSVTKGSLELKLTDPDGNVVEKFDSSTSGEKTIQITKEGTYKIAAVGNSTGGKYVLRWEKLK